MAKKMKSFHGKKGLKCEEKNFSFISLTLEDSRARVLWERGAEKYRAEHCY